MRCLARCGTGYAVEEREAPVTKTGQILVHVSHVSLNRADYMGESPLTRGKIVGSDICGTVVSCGDGPCGFSVGDLVCGVTPGLAGGAAELAVMDAAWAVKVPSGMSRACAAAFPSSAVTAYAGLSKLGDLAGKRVLVTGASGGVGQYAVLLAGTMGAEVTASCGARNLETALALGATRAIDYARGYAAETDASFDAIVAVNGKMPASVAARLLVPGGTFALIGTAPASAGLLTLPLRGARLKVGLFFSQIKRGGLQEVAGILACASASPLIEEISGLKAAATRIPEIAEQHPRGKVVIAL